MTEYIVKVENLAKLRKLAGLHVKETIEMTSGKIVRCRDCKHHHEGMCMLTDGMGDFKRWLVDDDGYCSDGERAVGA